ncbi:PHO85 cyclin-1 [Stylosanthes scabra]|uniref:PHO85 cyclin-1 n=1 Tax=Stylosanthes scabra TaxID=79078 RepID=A0ABU6WX50_9FABA|nr:PHO85 cyclin-1 [Stylosanthes scabra]
MSSEAEARDETPTDSISYSFAGQRRSLQPVDEGAGPQLHQHFLDALALLGINYAVPKRIMQLMSVEGLTRQNVAKHLQKYHLCLKRIQECSNEGPSSSSSN